MDALIKFFFAFLSIWLVQIQAAPRRARLSIAETPSYFYSNIDATQNTIEWILTVCQPESWHQFLGRYLRQADYLSHTSPIIPQHGAADLAGNANSYSFGYDVSDPATGNTQYRTEDRYPNGTVVGAYGYVDALGALQRFHYIADERGYRVSNDVPKPIIIEQMIYTTENPKSKPVESSITWSRPKRPNKKKSEVNNINTVPIDAKLPNRIFNNNNPPSYYALRE